MDSSNGHYVYLLREREFIKTGENVYKIGRTQKGFERVKSYPNGSELVFYIKCDDCMVLEKNLIRRFTELFEIKRDIGREYFEGDWKEMVKIINSEWDNQCPSHGVNSNGFFDENDDVKSLIRSCFDAWRNSRFNSICSKDNNITHDKVVHMTSNVTSTSVPTKQEQQNARFNKFYSIHKDALNMKRVLKRVNEGHGVNQKTIDVYDWSPDERTILEQSIKDRKTQRRKKMLISPDELITRPDGRVTRWTNSKK